MRRACIAAVVGVVALVGCGGGGSSGPQTAKDAADEYVAARNSGDAGKVCELYSQQLIQQLRTSNCVAFVQEQTSGTATDLTVLHVSESGDHATATIQAQAGGVVANAIAPIELKLA